MPDSTRQSAARPPIRPLPLAEFVAMTAMLMATNAVAIDIMLPALPQMGERFGIAQENDRQLIVISYMIGFSISQLVYGPLTDRFGRRNVLFISLGCYAIAGVCCIFSPTFTVLIASRVFQGASAGGSRVIAVSAARDLYAGRTMAKVMSLAMIVFMAAPILAPSIGQALLQFVDWKGIFWFLALFGAVMFLWVLIRLRETLPPERRVPLNLRTMTMNYFRILCTRESLGYTIASGLIFGGLMSYVSSSEQIYHEVYHTGTLFPIWFAGAAGAMSLSNLINSRFVERLGMRKMSHGALIGFVIVTGLHAFLALQGPVPFAIFYALMLVAFFMIGFQGPNYSAIAMEPLGALAGSAAALIGFASSFASALIGGYIARQFNGTITPILVGQFAVSFLALATVWVTERGRLMQPHHLPPPSA